MSSGCSMRSARNALVAAAAVVVALVVASPTTPARPKLHGGAFFSNCRFSHTGPDDPIVSPGEPGRSHHHTFFGNTSTNAYSTLASLRAAGTTCKPASDLAAYWIPTLYQDGREVRPAKAQVYYVLRGYAEMRAFPAGLRMIAGDAHARRPQSTRITYWGCAGHAVKAKASSSVPATCPVVRAQLLVRLRGKSEPSRVSVESETSLQLRVDFPDCWDGRRLDSADHRSHMAYSKNYVCPKSHPVKVPLIQLMIRYPIKVGKGVTLASGGQFSGHADFVNAWDQEAFERLVESCFHDRGCDPARSAR